LVILPSEQQLNKAIPHTQQDLSLFSTTFTALRSSSASQYKVRSIDYKKFWGGRNICSSTKEKLQSSAENQFVEDSPHQHQAIVIEKSSRCQTSSNLSWQQHTVEGTRRRQNQIQQTENF